MVETNIARKRGRPGGRTGSDLLAVAREVFLANGYGGTTMDAVSASAEISKQTLYRQYPSKESLYAAVVRDWVDRGYDAMRPHIQALLAAADVAGALLQLATALQRGVLSPGVIQMRALIAAQADASPDVAAEYVTRSWDRNQRQLADAFETLANRGLLRVDSPALAAEQFTWLTLAAPLNRLTLQPSRRPDTRQQLHRIATEAVNTFLSRFGADRPH